MEHNQRFKSTDRYQSFLEKPENKLYIPAIEIRGSFYLIISPVI